jgi:hypothetical protein
MIGFPKQITFIFYYSNRVEGGLGNNLMFSLCEIILEVGFFDGITSNKFRGGDLSTRKRGRESRAVENWSPNLLT